MQLKKKLIFLPLLCVAIYAAQANPTDTLSLEGFMAAKQIKAEKTKEGIYFTVNTEGVGAQPRNGDYVQIRYTGRLLNGKTFDESPKEEPFVFQVGFRQVIMGWDVMIPRFKVGTKATLYVPSSMAYGNTGIGDVIPPDAALIYDLEIVGVLTHDDYDAYMRSLEDKEKKAFEKRAVEQFEVDKKRINEYALDHKWKVQRSETGLSFLITKPGKGEKIKEGNEVTVHYEGLLLDDKVFDSTKGKSPFTFTMGEGRVIAGWEEGLKQFAKGSEGYLLIPSRLAYGATPLDDGKIIVPAYSVLIFKIQVVDVK